VNKYQIHVLELIFTLIGTAQQFLWRILQNDEALRISNHKRVTNRVNLIYFQIMENIFKEQLSENGYQNALNGIIMLKHIDKKTILYITTNGKFKSEFDYIKITRFEHLLAENKFSMLRKAVNSLNPLSPELIDTQFRQFLRTKYLFTNPDDNDNIEEEDYKEEEIYYSYNWSTKDDANTIHGFSDDLDDDMEIEIYRNDEISKPAKRTEKKIQINSKRTASHTNHSENRYPL
jgi:hypothetical protein